MPRSWLVDARGIAKKVKNASLPFANQIKDCGAQRECPKCHHLIDNSDVSHSWPGLPAGVKFDPSDVEILEHLAAKCMVGNSTPHMFIDEFIPTLYGNDGICYTHPKNLPGAKEDGSIVYFFHIPTNAYATGQRKRRKIQTEDSLTKEHVRWHKTGKTKPVMENGNQKGCKKIMVLYRSVVKGSKPGKSNWVMHQYHLGNEEDEKDGQYVVSKIFYQQHKPAVENDNPIAIMESGKSMMRTSPKTPKTNTPNPPRLGKSDFFDDVMDDYTLESPIQEAEFTKEMCCPSSQLHSKDEIEYPSFLAGESQDVDLDSIEDSLLCNERLDSYPLHNLGPHHGPSTAFLHDTNNAPGAEKNETCGITELENLEIDTPPDFQLANLQFCSQDVDLDSIEDSLLCNERLDSYPLHNLGPHHGPSTAFLHDTNNAPGAEKNETCGITELENLEIDTPPDFQLANLQFCSQDSIFEFLDRL